jgi:hypothetical protein
LKQNIYVTETLVVGLAHGNNICSSTAVQDLDIAHLAHKGDADLRALVAESVVKQVSHVFLVSIDGSICVPLKYRGVNVVDGLSKVAWHKELIDELEKMGFSVIGASTDGFSGVETFRRELRKYVRATHHHDWLHFPDYIHLLKVWLAVRLCL